MNGFIPCKEQIKLLIAAIMKSEEHHSKWLNTLSYMENSGARKIASCEHPTLVKEEMLKHASEEFRHAHYLKRQIGRVSAIPRETYSSGNILGGQSSLQYLVALDVKACRYLKEAGFSQPSIREAAYVLVTYAIELRASELYPIYEDALRNARSRVTVMSILLEEKEHLHEMEAGLNMLSDGFVHAQKICSIESTLCSKWIEDIKKDLQSPPVTTK